MKLKRTAEIRTPAKINLFLNIQGKRSDGYHELVTDLIPISLFDRITFSPPSGQHSELACNVNLGPVKENLVVKAIEGLETYTGKKLHLNIKLEKTVPMGAGLGGGSSNAAGTLVALNRLFELNLARVELAELALALGADVSFFLQPRPALARGIGEILTFIPHHDPLYLLLIYPGFPISTREAFSECFISGRQTIISDYSWQNLTNHTPETNDFWRSLVNKYPELEGCRKRLLEAGAVFAGLSGSGSTIFGIFPDEKSRDTAFVTLTTIKNWQCFRCATLNNHTYL